MTRPRASATALAAAIVAFEVERDPEHVVEQVMAKLRPSVERLVGSHGFDALLTRALKLAGQAEPALVGRAAVGQGNILQGLGGAQADIERGLSLVISHVFELLVRFIGEDLATRIVAEGWPSVTNNAGGPEETTR